MVRKIIQIAFETTGDAEEVSSLGHALCDDETIWFLKGEYKDNKWVYKWELWELPPIPQREV